MVRLVVGAVVSTVVAAAVVGFTVVVVAFTSEDEIVVALVVAAAVVVLTLSLGGIMGNLLRRLPNFPWVTMNINVWFLLLGFN